ncbi:MAG: hypothetical protein IPJ82_22565 [Lewinellaceae bacterium]|nr:hypothetical protein [Lewinellaceae bacterium]
MYKKGDIRAWFYFAQRLSTQRRQGSAKSQRVEKQMFARSCVFPLHRGVEKHPVARAQKYCFGTSETVKKSVTSGYFHVSYLQNNSKTLPNFLWRFSLPLRCSVI